MLNCFADKSTDAVVIDFITEQEFSSWKENQSSHAKNWMGAQKFLGKSESFCVIPDKSGKIEKVIAIGTAKHNFIYMGSLATALPEGIYYVEKLEPSAALFWGMGAYQFTKYKKAKKNPSKLVLPKGHENITAQLHAIYTVRNLINTPTENMGPADLSAAAKKLASEFKADFNEIIGEDLLKQNYPAIHAVGRASTNPPRLLELNWGNKKHPKITLVGKGVCFDTGGLDIKPAVGMLGMKKDMGGAAHVLGLAALIMHAKLPVKLRVLIPAVENAISGNAYRPGDVINTRKGLTVEIGNTDAEGRVILADALFEASSEKPELILDFATLTGAARVAMGTDISALFTDDNHLANELIAYGEKLQDPIWRMPLYTPYRKLIDSTIADLNNAPTSMYGGAITAALFLKEFVSESISWAHFDIMAWNCSTSSAHPEGAEAMGIRAVFEYLQHRFSARSSVG
ncbi:MAG TPA: leucyl aminopeptidase family protein [Gammaproteobacteria bacterium]|nr:leucyl aminopeptidase family protein [Gammaproteobacteria bacterium]